MAPGLRAASRLGKYKIRRRIASGGFATVYEALDTVEGVRVALKVPFAHLVDKETLELFRREARLCARLDHPNILAIKNAAIIDDQFVIATQLAERSLGDRLRNRLSREKALSYCQQMLEALAYAHKKRVLHCDLKPDNFLIFPDERIRLTDFGIAKVARATVAASGSGTLGYMAPEQAMGRPSLRSDVFSLALIFHRMFAGVVPEWPFEWPLPGHSRLKSAVHPDFVKFLQKCLMVRPEKRFADAQEMLQAFLRIKPRALKVPASARARSKRLRTSRQRRETDKSATWEQVRWREFQRQYRTQLGTNFACSSCKGPIAESMRFCPWCTKEVKRFPGETKFPRQCGRCKRGVKLDWRFCASCYGAGLPDVSERSYTDVRYSARCSNQRCSRKDLMPFMRYCPWCRTKVRRAWPLPETKHKCGSCGWGVARDFWSNCPWCSASIQKGQRR